MKNKSRRKRINKIDYSYDYDIVESIGELHEKYIKLFIDLHTHQTVVDADFYLESQKNLTKQYQDELELLRAQAKPKTEAKFYMAESISEVLEIALKRRRAHWYSLRGHWENSPMKEVLDERIEREAQGFLNDLINGIEPQGDEEEEPMQEQNEETPDTDEPDEASEEKGQTVAPEAVEDADVQEVPELPYEPDEEYNEFEDDEDYEIKEGELDELYALEDELNEDDQDDPGEAQDLIQLAAAQQTIAGVTFVPMEVSEPQKNANYEAGNENGTAEIEDEGQADEDDIQDK